MQEVTVNRLDEEIYTTIIGNDKQALALNNITMRNYSIEVRLCNRNREAMTPQAFTFISNEVERVNISTVISINIGFFYLA
jgi:hypothetical protein